VLSPPYKKEERRVSMERNNNNIISEWKKRSIEYSHLMSNVKWTPVADTFPNRSGGYFKKGNEYTGTPYSSVKYVGRYIGFEIFLKTFLAAVANPQSILYTETLAEKVKNAAGYYGTVCSAFTSYAYQCAFWYVSRVHNPPYRNGVVLVDPQDSQGVEAGDYIFTPPLKPNDGSHVELITEVVKQDDITTHVRVEDSWPPTTRNLLRTSEEFNKHIGEKERKVYRIIDIDLWRGENKAENFLFPNYAEDSVTPDINRTLLLDLGDWVTYHKGQNVKINVMDKDSQGVKTLVIKRGNKLVLEIPLTGPSVIERSFAECADYTAYCIMKDGSTSTACEFSVGELDFCLPSEEIKITEPWDIKFSSDNIKPILIYFTSLKDSYGCCYIWITEEDCRKGRLTVPANFIKSDGEANVWFLGENKYGRLKKHQRVMAVK